MLGPHGDRDAGRRLTFVICLSPITDLEGRLWRCAAHCRGKWHVFQDRGNFQ